jgi:hypothetical protein
MQNGYKVQTQINNYTVIIKSNKPIINSNKPINYSNKPINKPINNRNKPINNRNKQNKPNTNKNNKNRYNKTNKLIENKYKFKKHNYNFELIKTFTDLYVIYKINYYKIDIEIKLPIQLYTKYNDKFIYDRILNIINMSNTIDEICLQWNIFAYIINNNSYISNKSNLTDNINKIRNILY